MAKRHRSKKRSEGRKAQTRKPAKLSAVCGVIVSWLQAHSLATFLILMALGSLRIVSTYNVFSHTSDEPVHIACGMEWLSKHSYRYEAQHPPLARVATAIGPYLAGVRSYGTPTRLTEGLAVLFRDGHYDRNLFLARLGILPFFWLASLVVYLSSKRYFGELTAAFAVFFFTFLPPVLAHAGLATTDMAVTAMVGASFIAGVLWLERPTARYSLFFGALTGLAVLSKFSALPFIPASFATAFIWHVFAKRSNISSMLQTAKTRLPTFALAVLTGIVTIWAGYRFSFGAVSFSSLHLPAPELYAGIQEVMHHNRAGHRSYLLGQRSQFGWWYYYLVVLAVKTPLPFLVMLMYGLVRRKERKLTFATGLAMAFSLGILLFSLKSQINIGVRHILPVYLGFAIVAGTGAAGFVDRTRRSRVDAWIFGGLLLWMIATSLLSHPDYLSYFNAFAGNEPEQVLVDSDLDWNQDLRRLAKRLQEVGAREVAYSQFSLCDPMAQGLPSVKPFDPLKPLPGWHAANLTMLKSLRFRYADHPEVKLWPENIKPTERVGKGMLLWYFPPNEMPK
jgi:hypothetical protein